MSTEEQIIAIVSDEMGEEPGKVMIDSRLVEDLGADSLDIAEIAMRCEEEFNIETLEDDQDSLRTVGDLVDLVTKLKENQ